MGDISNRGAYYQNDNKDVFPTPPEISSFSIEALRQQQKQSKMPQEIIGSHSVHCKQNLFVMHLNKNTGFQWNFSIKSKRDSSILIKRMFLLESHMPEFCIEHVKVGYCIQKMAENCQLWECSGCDAKISSIQFSISFISNSYGNFQQHLIFEFQKGDKILRTIEVQVLPEHALMKTLTYKPTKHVENELSWIEKYKIIPFDGEPEVAFKDLKYTLPPNTENLLSFDAFDNLEKKLTSENYRKRLHLLLHIEECKRRQELQKLSFEMDDIHKFIHNPIPGLHKNRILKVPSDDYYTEQASRLIGKKGKALVKIHMLSQGARCKIYEVLLEQILSDEFTFEMSSELDVLLQTVRSKLKATVCFRFVDVFQFMHSAIDKINLEDVFPLHASHQRQIWDDRKFQNLSMQQSAALRKMIENQNGPPVLLLGPFGSGKTKTIAQAVIELYESMRKVQKYDHRILICTHSNSAADHYIEDFLDPYLNGINPGCPVLIRVNWELRYTASVSSTVLKYCKISHGRFLQPTKEEVEKHSIVITTLVTADLLNLIGIKKGFFSHIFIDEAAQAMEVEAIIPFVLKDRRTKIILAGDHLQLGAPLSSQTAIDLGLGTSLLERLFQEYPSDSPYKLKLLENYRSFKEIVDVSSRLFYEGALISNKQRPHGIDYPVKFFGIHGKEEISKYHPSIYNLMEAHEVLQRILDLIDNWPRCLGDLKHSKICVLSCFSAQIQEIRLLLRRNGLSGVKVENVNNVQGLEFDVIVISTVRCYIELSQLQEKQIELGFFGSPKLFNTAITRAKYFCIIIGEPIGLCSFGQCKALWKTVLAMCNMHKEFHYRLTYKEVIDVSEELRETLKEGHAAGMHSLERIRAREDNCLIKRDYAVNDEMVKSTDHHSVSNNNEKESSNALKYVHEYCPNSNALLDIATENAVLTSPTPTEVSCFSDSSYIPMASQPEKNPTFNEAINSQERNLNNARIHKNSAATMPSNSVKYNRAESFEFFSTVNQLLPSERILPSHDSIVGHPPFALNVGQNAVVPTTSVAALFIDLDLCNVYVTHLMEYMILAVPNCGELVSELARAKNSFTFEIQRLQCREYPENYVHSKLHQARHFYWDVMSQLDNMLLQVLPNASFNEFKSDVIKFDSMRNLLVDLKLLLESSMHSFMSYTKPEFLQPAKVPPVSVRQGHDSIIFILHQLDHCYNQILCRGFHPRWSSLLNFKLSFLAGLIGNLQSNLKKLSVTSLSDISDTLSKSPSKDQKLSVHDRFSMPIRQMDVSPLHPDEAFLERSEKTRSQNTGSAEKSIFMVDNEHQKAYKKDEFDDESTDGQNEDDLVSELLRLTTEYADEDDEIIDDVSSLIRKLRHNDTDVNEWFVDRETDNFVVEYIKCFERFRASISFDPNLHPVGSGEYLNKQNAQIDRNEFDAMKKFKMEPPYQPYQGDVANQLEGVMSFEASVSFEKPSGVILYGRRRICFPDLSSTNRSLDGDRVFFKIVGKYGKHERGQVTNVIERKVKSLKCKVSLNESCLFLSVDDRGPPLIALNASESSSLERHTVGGSVQIYSVKVIGWPLEMKFPLGLVERDAQEHVES